MVIVFPNEPLIPSGEASSVCLVGIGNAVRLVQMLVWHLEPRPSKECSSAEVFLLESVLQGKSAV